MLIKTSHKAGPRVLDSKELQDEYVAKELSRRHMVQAAMLGSVGTWLGAAGLLGCSSATTTSSPTGTKPGPTGTDPTNPDPTKTDPTKKPAHLVGMGYSDTDRNAALKAALAETIGLGMIKAGQSVCLRVNSNSGDLYPYSTSADTILAVGGMLKDLGVTDLRIGDRSFWGDTGTAKNLTNNGIAGAAQKLGTKAVVYDDTVEWVTLPAGSTPNWTGTVRFPKDVTSADHILILSVVKTHFIATVTMALKLQIGIVHAADRQRAGNLLSHDTNVLHKQVAQLNKAITPSLVIMDGYQAVISGGPTKRDRPPGAPSSAPNTLVGDPKVFIVSTDLVAADVTGIAVLQDLAPTYEHVQKTKPFANPAIKEAVAAGLGIADASAYDLSGPTVPKLDTYKAKVTG